MGDTEVLTVEEAATYLKVSTSLVRRLVRAGTIGGFRVGREWRIEKGELMRYMREGGKGRVGHDANNTI